MKKNRFFLNGTGTQSSHRWLWANTHAEICRVRCFSLALPLGGHAWLSSVTHASLSQCLVLQSEAAGLVTWGASHELWVHIKVYTWTEGSEWGAFSSRMSGMREEEGSRLLYFILDSVNTGLRLVQIKKLQSVIKDVQAKKSGWAEGNATVAWSAPNGLREEYNGWKSAGVDGGLPLINNEEVIHGHIRSQAANEVYVRWTSEAYFSLACIHSDPLSMCDGPSSSWQDKKGGRGQFNRDTVPRNFDEPLPNPNCL